MSKQKPAAAAALTRGHGKFRLVIADENPLCRRGLRVLLQEDNRFELVAETSHGDGALKAILEHKPDAAVLDASLTDITALEVATLLKAKNRLTPLVILASEKDEKLFNQSISVGIKGFVLKKNNPSEILDCIAAVASGEVYVSSVLTDFLLRRRNNVEVLTRRKPGLGSLTAAERRVLKRIAQGKTSREIARECSISPRTVDSHRAHICEKLGLRGSNRLLQFALEHRDALSHLEPQHG